MEIVPQKRKGGKHFDADRRYLLECYYFGRKGFPRIRDTARLADIFGCSRRTIQREIRRGMVLHMKSDLTEVLEYNSEYAQNIADGLKETKGRPLKIGSDHALEAEIVRLVKEGRYSPYAVVRTFENGSWPGKARICEKTLYNYINGGLFAEISSGDLPNKGASYRKKEKKPRYSTAICALKSIDGRPDGANSREEAGHWEIDTVHGPQGGSAACLLTLTERRHRREIARLMKDCAASSLVAELDKIQKENPLVDFSDVFKTITGDCGRENLDADGIERGGRTRMFYAHPYSSWERGTNERHNRMLRRFFPKGTDFADVTEKQVRAAQDWMNSYPRKVLGGISPAESWLRDTQMRLLS